MNNDTGFFCVEEETDVLKALSWEQRLLMCFIEGGGRKSTLPVCLEFASRQPRNLESTLLELIESGCAATSDHPDYPHILSARDTFSILEWECSQQPGWSFGVDAIASSMNEAGDAIEKNLEALLRLGFVECIDSCGYPTWKISAEGGQHNEVV